MESEAMMKRSSSDVSFPVDESVSKLIVSIRATKNYEKVKLVDGSGKDVPHKLNMNQGKLWIIANPSRGTWKILVPSDVRGFSYQVKIYQQLLCQSTRIINQFQFCKVPHQCNCNLIIIITAFMYIYI